MEFETLKQIIADTFSCDEAKITMEASLADKVEAVGLNPIPPAVRMTTGRVFEQYTTYPIHPETAQKEHNQQYRRAIEHVRKLNLIPGPVMLKEVISYTLKDGIRQVYCILRIPVEEK